MGIQIGVSPGSNSLRYGVPWRLGTSMRLRPHSIRGHPFHYHSTLQYLRRTNATASPLSSWTGDVSESILILVGITSVST